MGTEGVKIQLIWILETQQVPNVVIITSSKLKIKIPNLPQRSLPMAFNGSELVRKSGGLSVMCTPPPLLRPYVEIAKAAIMSCHLIISL